MLGLKRLSKGNSIAVIIFGTMLIGIAAVGILFLCAWLVMLLWNYAAVVAIGAIADPIGYWHAMCLILLTGLLFRQVPFISKRS